ncbi:MAG: riboflavin biosynthesis protein RibF, partial [Bacteroidota bacterium]|nr:riboflavin biosynthesis protein RibF [Bacteroidota bacterium]
MIIHNGYEGLSLKHPLVTMGVFDGVHRGHRALLDYLVLSALKGGGESVVVTFNPHPRLVLPGSKEGLSFLTTLEEKTKLLEQTSVGHLIIIRFDGDLSNLEASEFIRRILVQKIGIKHFIIGYDHHFGKNRKGDLGVIESCGKLYNFSVEQVNEVSVPEGTISSTAIREALLSGRLEDANKWLGYFYSLGGKIVPGRKLGRSLGFPTANIRPDDDFKLVPANGVYAVNVRIGEKTIPGVMSIGFNPTVNKDLLQRFLEVHIFDFTGNLYGQDIRVTFRFRL